MSYNQKYISLDVETANRTHAICQIGIVVVKDGEIIDSFERLINPESPFEYHYSKVHGIKSRDVLDAPTFAELYDLISELCSDQIVLHHGGSDPVALSLACKRYNLPLIESSWVNTIEVAQEYLFGQGISGYGLSNLADYFNLSFTHHNALEDAIVTAKIYSLLCDKSEINILDFARKYPEHSKLVVRSTEGIRDENEFREVKIEGIEGRPFSNETVVFTNIDKSKELPVLAKKAQQCGFSVDKSVTKSRTTFLVVGNLSRSKYDSVKTTKQKKAEELISRGRPIRIMNVDNFERLLTTDYIEEVIIGSNHSPDSVINQNLKVLEEPNLSEAENESLEELDHTESIAIEEGEGEYIPSEIYHDEDVKSEPLGEVRHGGPAESQVSRSIGLWIFSVLVIMLVLSIVFFLWSIRATKEKPMPPMGEIQSETDQPLTILLERDTIAIQFIASRYNSRAFPDLEKIGYIDIVEIPGTNLYRYYLNVVLLDGDIDSILSLIKSEGYPEAFYVKK